MKKQLVSAITALAMLPTVLPSAALAVDGDNVPDAETVKCLCTEVCTQDTMNPDCPVCGQEGAVLADCAAAAADTGSDMAEQASTQHEMEPITVEQSVSLDDADLPDNEELFNDYVAQMLYGDSGISLLANYGQEALTGKNLELYNTLKAGIEKVAANGGSTVFTSDITITWNTTKTGDELKTEAAEKFAQEINKSKIVDCLLADCPYELYWFDKTEGYQFGYSFSSNGTSATIQDLKITFQVAGAYQDSTTTTVNATKANTAKTAVANAQQIIEDNAGKSDYEKLIAYKEAICNLTAYNDEAAGESYQSGYGDPWQIIYVFDKDEGTKVVCEGYAKAFQYLCDQSSFENAVCYTVTGNMAGGTGAGGHMWNIVKLDGQNYLVDVANSDQGSIGQDGGLFLVGNASGSMEDGYTFLLSKNITFTYDNDIKNLYGTEVLTLAPSDYKPPVVVPDATISGTQGTNGWYTSPVSLNAPDGYQISDSKDGSSWLDILTISDDNKGETPITYYLKPTSGTQDDVAEKTVTLKIDQTKPTISSAAAATEDIGDTYAKVTVAATDATSGVTSYTLTKTAGTGEPSIQNNNDGTFSITGMTANTEYTFTATVQDNAGNVSEAKTVTFTTQKILPVMTAEPQFETAVYGTKLRELKITGGTVNVDGTWELDEAGADSIYPTVGGTTAYTVKFVPKENAGQYGDLYCELTPTITPKALTILNVQLNTKTYDGTTTAPVDSVVFEGLVNSNSLTKDTDYSVKASYVDANAGSDKAVTATVTLLNTDTAKNYSLPNGTYQLTGVITQAKATANAGTMSVTNKQAGTYSFDLAQLLPGLSSGCTFGDVTYTLDAETLNDQYYTDGAKIEGSVLTLPINSVESETADEIGTITIQITSTNYQDMTATITVSSTNQLVPMGTPTLSTNILTYGDKLSKIELSGAMQDANGTSVAGAFAWNDPEQVLSAGTHNAAWTFTPSDTAKYQAVSGVASITVNKATPTGTPAYTAINTSGKTLKDANLQIGSLTPEGVIDWDDGEDTVVVANKAYTWTFTPNDNSNYNNLTGSIVLWKQSSGGGSSSGSSSGGSSTGNKTETTENSDGSTTTTVTSSNGTVTETTKYKDGSKEVVETKKDGTVTTTMTDADGNKTKTVENPDGSSVTTIDNKDGTSSKTTVDENGKVEVNVELPSSVVNTAADNGEAVALPMPSVRATSDRESAPTITVDLPAGKAVPVEIPVKSVTAGTVAVLVKADGTEEVIKTSLTTSDGVQVALSDGDTVKIVDNSKSFADVPTSGWQANAVAFATSRELFAGTGDNTFSPNQSMSRAMIWTVLARFDGADTTQTGANWYQAGLDWAVANGISDGSNPNGAMTREQLVTMLYRYAGSPATSGNLSAFNDAAQVSSYAVDAMTWATENGILNGDGAGSVTPKGQASRVQVAQIMQNFITYQSK